MDKITIKENIIAYVIINLVPMLLLLLHVNVDLNWVFPNLENSIFIYNYINSWILSYILWYWSEFIKLIFILIYNIFILFIFNNIKIFKNHFILFIFIYSLLSSILLLFFFWALMSV